VSDPHHPLLLTDPNGLTTELRVQGKDFDCVFDGDFTPRGPGSRPPELFNLNGPSAHNGRLRRNLRNNFDKSKVLMKLPPANISVRGTSLDYFVEEVAAGTPPVSIAPVATIIRFDSELTSAQMVVRVARGPVT